MHGNNMKVPPLETKIKELRDRLKSSNRETLEDCEHLRTEIRGFYLQLARTTRPGRYANRRKKHRSKDNRPVNPEVLPPDLDVMEYLRLAGEMAAGEEDRFQDNNRQHENIYQPDNNGDEIGTGLIPFERTPAAQTEVATVNCNLMQYEKQREETIEDRFAVVAERMAKRRRRWLEEQETKKPWWKL